MQYEPKSRLSLRAVPVVVLIFALLMTLQLYRVSSAYYEQMDATLFHAKVADAVNRIELRIHSYTYAMHAGLALLESSDDVTRDEWKAFVTTLETQNYYHEGQEIGYASMVAPSKRASFEADIRGGGMPDFLIHPQGMRPLYSAIVYLEPQNERNRAAIGFDMFSEPLRREAMQRARDTNAVAISGAVTSIPEIDGEIQNGFLMYLPYYQKNLPVDTPEQRRLALQGYVFSPFRMKAVMNGILGEAPPVDFEIRDMSDIFDTKPFYRSCKLPKTDGFRFSETHTMVLGGRNWEVHFTESPTFETHGIHFEPAVLAAFGTLFSLLLFMVLHSLFKSREELHLYSRDLAASNNRYKSLLELSTDGVHVLDMQGNLIECSDSFLRQLGYTKEDLPSLNVVQWDKGFTPVKIRQEIEKLPAGEIIHVETRHRRKDGVYIDVEVLIKPVTINGEPLVFASSRDTTERNRIRQALIEEKETAQRYLDIVDVIILVLDQNYNVTMINRKGCEIIGYEPHEVIGKNWIANFLPEDARPDVKHVGETLLDHDEKSINYFENPVLTKSGEERLISWRNTPLYNLSGEISGILTSGEDITERRFKEKLYLMQVRQAQMGEMISMIAHQWRQPLTVINTIASTLRIKEAMLGNAEGELVESLKKIEEQTLYLSRTVTDFREFFRPDKPKEAIALATIISNMNNLLDHSIKSNTIALEVIQRSNPILWTYPNEVLQVLITLFKNTLDAFLENAIETRTIRITTDMTADSGVIMFEDNAGGIPKANIEKIFNPYFTTKSSVNGTGLGLYMSKMLIEGHCNGRLEVESSAGETRFFIYLPLKEHE